MFRIIASTLFLFVTAAGCVRSTGQAYKSDDWKDGHHLGNVLVIVPNYPAGDAAKQEKIQDALRRALQGVPGVSGVEMASSSADPVSESQAIAMARNKNIQTVCIVTVGQFGGHYLLTALPPGWESRTTVQYSIRLIDVNSARVLIDAVRERTAGGYLAIMTATYPDDLREDVSSVLSTAR